MFKLEKNLKKIQKRFERDEKIIKENTIDYLEEQLDKLEDVTNHSELYQILAETEKRLKEREENKRQHQITMMLLKTAIERVQKNKKDK